jgi:uncharacterized protein (TIGR02246 family)
VSFGLRTEGTEQTPVKEVEMKTLHMIGVFSIGAILGTVVLHLDARANGEAEIRALEQRFADAFKAKDVDRIMSCYVPDDTLFVFDIVPPRQYVGAKAYRKDWEDFFGAYPGPLTFELTDLQVTADGSIGYGHSIQRVVMTDKSGEKLDLTTRVTDGYRKIGGKWLVTQEHISVPVDLETAKADWSSRP